MKVPMRFLSEDEDIKALRRIKVGCPRLASLDDETRQASACAAARPIAGLLLGLQFRLRGPYSP